MRRSFFRSTIKILGLSFFVILITILISSNKSYAETSNWPSDPSENLPVVVREKNQDLTAIVEDGSGGAYIFWWEGSRGNALYAQRIDAAGNKLWAEDGVAVHSQVITRAVRSENGGVIVVWDSADGQMRRVYAKYIDPDGNVMWDSGDGKGMLISGELTGQDPVIVSDGDGGAVIAWTGFLGVNRSILAQRVDQNGQLLWNQNGVPLTLYGFNKRNQKIVRTSEGNFVVAWKQHASFLNSDIYAQMIDSDGNLLW